MESTDAEDASRAFLMWSLGSCFVSRVMFACFLRAPLTRNALIVPSSDILRSPSTVVTASESSPYDPSSNVLRAARASQIWEASLTPQLWQMSLASQLWEASLTSQIWQVSLTSQLWQASLTPQIWQVTLTSQLWQVSLTSQIWQMSLTSGRLRELY